MFATTTVTKLTYNSIDFSTFKTFLLSTFQFWRNFMFNISQIKIIILGFFPRVWDQIKRRSSCQILPLSDSCKKPPDLYRDVNHPAILSIRVVKVSWNQS